MTLSNDDLERHSIRVLCNANTSEGYVPYKDVSLPEIHLPGGHMPAALGGPPVDNRPHLAFFAGGDHGPVRPQLFKYWEGKDQDVIVYKQLPKELNYQDLMKNSRSVPLGLLRVITLLSSCLQQVGITEQIEIFL